METTTTTSPPPTSTDDFPEDPAVIPEIPDINTSEEKMLDACKQTDPSDLQKEDDKKDAQNTDTSNITEEEEEEEEEGQKQKENQEQSQPESEKKTEEKSAPMQEVHITTVETTRPENTKEDEVKERHSSEPEAGEEPSKEEAEPESSRTGGTISITSKARENAKSEGGEWVPIEVEVAHHLESLIHEEKKSDITGVLEASVKAQETMGEGLLSRIVFDAGVLGAVHNHFYARARASEAYAAATAALPPLAVGSQNLLGTSLENGLEYLKRVGRTESDNFGQMGKFLRDACKELADLRAELLADHKRCTVDNTQLVRGLYAQLEVVIGSYSAAMSGLEETQKNVKALSQPTAKDPWVAQLKYYGTLTRLNTLQAEYSSHLARLASHTKSQELRQCSLIENISKKFLAFENTAFTKIVTDIHIAEDMLAKTNPENDWNIFLKSHPLSKCIPDDGLDKDCAKKCIPYHEFMRTDSDSTSSLSVVRCGEIEYGSLLSWKRYTAVLTNFGFLHLFSVRNYESRPTSSSSGLAASQQGKGSQGITSGGAQEVLGDACAENTKGLNHHHRHLVDIPTEDPQITIPVTRCKMAVKESNTIRMSHVVPGTFFNSTFTHDIRLGSTDDLVAWMIDLRHFMPPVV